MFRFSYPAEKWDELALDKNSILALVKKHEGMMGRLWRNKQYYDGQHDILSRKRTTNESAPDAKVVCNHAKDIADTASGYFMGNPLTYSNSEAEDITPLLLAFDEAAIDDVDAENALEMSIYGAGYEYVYVKKDTTTPISRNISALSTFIIVDDTIEENELAGVYYYKKRDSVNDTYTYVATVGTENFIYTITMESTTESADVLMKTPKPVTEQGEPHHFGGVPFIEYLNNKEGIGDFEQQIPLIDAYNTLMSDRVTDKEQFIDAILVLYGAILGDDEEETDEAQKKLRKEKLLELPSDAKAEYLSRQMDEGGAEVLRKAIKEDIYNFSHVPNFQDESFAGNTSGVAMEYKLLGLEMLTKIKERYYKKGIRKRIRLYCNFLGLKQIMLDAGSIMPTFSRALPKNLQELANIVANLQGDVSKRTLLKLLPFVEDPDYEIEETEKEAEAAVKRQQDFFRAGENTPPEDDEDEETEKEEKEEE